MRPGNLSTAVGQLYGAIKDWRVRREATKTGWGDNVRREFEEKHCNPVEEQTLRLIQELEELSQVVSQMKSDIA